VSHGFAVTFERWNQESIEAGETNDNGFIIVDVSLRDAIQLGLEYSKPSYAGACEASCSNLAQARWLTFHKWNDGTRDYYENGIDEQRALHIPDSVTPSSRKRIARLFS